MTGSTNTLTLLQLKGLNSDYRLHEAQGTCVPCRGDAAVYEVGNSGKRSLIAYPGECDKESPGRTDMRTLRGPCHRPCLKLTTLACGPCRPVFALASPA
jgi:hypothetical protein